MTTGTISELAMQHGLKLNVYSFKTPDAFIASFGPDVCVVEDGLFIHAVGRGYDIPTAISSLARRLDGSRIIRQWEDRLAELGTWTLTDA